MEPGRVHVYPLRWDPPEPGSPHLQSQICQSGSVDTRSDPGMVLKHSHGSSGSDLCFVL